MPLALMGVRCFLPHNTIGLEGLVIRLGSCGPCRRAISFHLASSCGLGPSANTLRSCGHIILISREQCPGDSCRLVGERDNRSIESAPRRKPFQPFGTAIAVLGQPHDHGTSTVDHLPPKVMIGPPANAPETGFASGRVLTRHQAYPFRKLPARPEMPAIINRGDERCRSSGPQGALLVSPRLEADVFAAL
jgi:hypothetical protein